MATVRSIEKKAEAAPSMSAPLKHWSLFGDWAARTANYQLDAFSLLALRPDPALWTEAFELQQALWKQFEQLGLGWQNGLSEWSQKFAKFDSPGSLAQLVQKEYELGVEFAQLCSQQTTNVVELMEGFHCNCADWVKDKVKEAQDVKKAA